MEAVPDVFEVIDVEHDNAVVFHGETLPYWGKKWGVHFWTMDLSDLREEGQYRIAIPGIGIHSNKFQIQNGLFLNQTLSKTSVDQLEARVRDKMGWQDCGSDMRGLEGNAVQLIGLVDVFAAFEPQLDSNLCNRLLNHIHHGAAYLIACQREDGSFVNEYYMARDRYNWTLAMLAIIALSRSFEVASEVTYLMAAKLGWDWCLGNTQYSEPVLHEEIEETRKIFDKFEPWYPPPGLRTRDKLLLIWAGTELYKNTNDLRYKEAAIVYANEVCNRLQHLDYSEFQHGIYGNFYAWPGDITFQRAWEHAGWGYNCGSILPDEISGLINLVAMFPQAREWLEWRYSLRQYAYGYLKQVSQLTPFGIYPLGNFEGEIRFFGPSWHGFNGMYARVAHNSMKLAQLFEDPEFERIALQNMQWIIGLNAGRLTENRRYQGISFICNVGENNFTPWTNIPGSIANGFCANPQFKLARLDDVLDLPKYISTEDWIVHTGMWLSGLSEIESAYRLAIKTLFRGRPISAHIQIISSEIISGITNLRGVLVVQGLHGPGRATVQLSWNDHVITRELEIIAGLHKTLIVDFADSLVASLVIRSADKRCLLTVKNTGLESTAIRIRLRSIGVSLDSQRLDDELATGEVKDFDIVYRADLDQPSRPGMVTAEITSDYSYAFCELDWKL